jgi:ATP-dependent RNA helicase RhlE
VNFADVEVLVVEEGDRTVGLGLAPDVRKLLKLLPETRQTLLFTLTLPPELNRLAKEALVEPVRVDVAPATAKPAAGITQAIYPVPRDLKFDLLDDLLSRAEVRSTIIFTRVKTWAERLAKQLKRHGHAVALLDEHPNQGERERALDDLRRGRVQILVASEAAARSLDVAGTAHVVNFHVPLTPEDYVHRLGRGGRADPVGDAFTLMSPDEQNEVAAIERFLGRAIPRVMLPDFDYGMPPREVKQVVAYEEEQRRAASGGSAPRLTVGSARREHQRRHGRPAPRPDAASRCRAQWHARRCDGLANRRPRGCPGRCAKALQRAPSTSTGTAPRVPRVRPAPAARRRAPHARLVPCAG